MLTKYRLYAWTGILILNSPMTNANSERLYFSGQIIYRNTFKVLPPEGIWYRLSQFIGLYKPEQTVFSLQTKLSGKTLYYISGNNYRSYTEIRQPVQLYTGASNSYYNFSDGRALPALNAALGTTEATVTLLPQVANVAGYKCQSLQVETGGTTTIYFFSHNIRVDPDRFVQHHYGNWSTYLKASHGALPLRFTVRNISAGYEWTSEATSVQAMALPASEFVVDAKPR